MTGRNHGFAMRRRALIKRALCLGTASLTGLANVAGVAGGMGIAGAGLGLAPGAALAKTPQAVLRANAVAVPDHYAADTAQQIFAAGGNAIDAGVAIAFSLAVTYPEAGNLGGGGFMTLVADGKPYFLDYRETAPGAATRDMYLDANGNVIDKLSLVGARAAGVPGTVAGMWEAQRRFGKLKWKQVLAPAIAYAQKGFVVSKQLAGRRTEVVADFKGRTNFDAYFSGLTEGATLRQPELAETLERIADKGASDFYTGETAGLIAQDMRGHGLITKEDLADYKAIWRQPLIGNWRGYQVVTAPPPSSGGIILLQMLKMRQDLNSKFANVEPNSAQYIHLVAEMEKRVFADRASYLGDPDFIKNPTAQLVDDTYLAKRAMEVNPDAISDTQSVKPGLGGNGAPGMAGASGAAVASSTGAASGATAGSATTHAASASSASSASAASTTPSASSAPAASNAVQAASPAPASGEKPQTTQFSVVDKWGNAVSNTYTLNGWFGSGVVVDKGGFLLNNEMDDFASKPNAPNQFGVVGSDANAIAPRKRPLSSMSPTILLDAQGKVAMVLGTPGGSRIPTTVYQVLSNVYDYQIGLPEAVGAFRFHHQLLPANTIYVENYKPVPDDQQKQLSQRGYNFKTQGFNGDVQAIRVTNGQPEAVADPRGSGVGREIP
jgi:gamma-glutamyltranspeptidase / glutathione hydrolase